MLLKTTDSAFRDFHRDEYRTLPDADDRLFATSLTGEWRYPRDTDWDAGYAAIQMAISEGISVNVTLLFSVEAYEKVANAFMTGLEQHAAKGGDISRIASVASFFISRVDSEVDTRLDQIATSQATQLKGKAAIASARLAYQAYEEVIASQRWQQLAGLGAQPQRPLWASTSTKDPRYPDVYYVEAHGCTPRELMQGVRRSFSMG